MRELLQQWTESSIILTSKEESVWRSKKAQKQDRFLRGRQIAYLIYDHFRITGTHASVENYTDLFTIVLRNDDIQEFDSEWDGILLSMTKNPTWRYLERFVQMKNTRVWETEDRIELYDLENHKKKLGPDYHRLKTLVKRSIEQDIRNKNFGGQKWKLWEERRGQESRDKTACTKNSWGLFGNGSPTGSVPEETIAVSVTISINVRKWHSRIRPPNSFMQQNERNASRTRSPRGKSPSGRMSRWLCKDYLEGTCTNSFCEKWHPPECLFHKTKSGCRFGGKVLICTLSCWWITKCEVQKEWWQKCSGHVEEEWSARKRMATCCQPWQKSRKTGETRCQAWYLSWVETRTCWTSIERTTNGFVSFNTWSRPKSILRKSSDMQKPIQRVKFTEAIARHTKIRDRNPSLGYICPG